MNVDGIRALLAVVSHGSLGAAGRELGVTQQAMSARIRMLETELGCALLVRSPRGSTLTPNGELVAGWARPLIDAADRFEAAATALRSGRSNRLSVVASLTIAEHLLPNWIADAFPGGTADVVLAAGNSTAVADGVRGGRHDLGFLESPDVPADLRSVTVATDELVLVVAPTHAWASEREIPLERLAATPLAVRERGSGTRRALEVEIERAGLRLSEPAAELPTSLAIRAAVATGFAPAVLSALAVRDDVAAGRLRRVPLAPHPLVPRPLVRPLTAVWSGREPAPAARRLLESIARG